MPGRRWESFTSSEVPDAPGGPCRPQGEPAQDHPAVPALPRAAGARLLADRPLRRPGRDLAVPPARGARHGDPGGRLDRGSKRADGAPHRPRRGDGRDPDRHRDPRRLADAALEPRRAGRDARPAHVGLPAPPAPVARVLHPHANRRGAEPDRERHRRDRERRHVDRDLRALQRHHGARDDHRDAAARLAAGRLRARPAPALRLAHEAGRRAAQEGDGRAPGVAGGRLVDRPGVALGLGDPARQDDGPVRRTSRSGSRPSRSALPGSRCERG